MKHYFCTIFLIIFFAGWLIAALVETADAAIDTCNAPNVGGTAELPAACPFIAPDDVMYIIDGLPSGTTIKCVPRFGEFWAITRTPGGPLGGEAEEFNSTLALDMTGTGSLAGWHRLINIPAQCRIDAAHRIPGISPQSIDLDFSRIQGQLLPGDPDFDLLRIVAGTAFGMPSPGHVTLTKLPSGEWNVDSFFDITYRIDFIGAPGGPLAGKSGSTSATIRWQQGVPGLDMCLEPDAGGTAELPAVCPYTAPYDVMYIQNGLPLGDTIKCVPVFDSFTGIIRTPGGPLGGELEQFTATLTLKMTGTGSLGGTFTSTLPVTPFVTFAAGPRVPGMSPMIFPIECFQLMGQITGDPDFDLLRITAGSGFGMPSPGQATLTKLPSGDWNVDSFFDITYRIDFIGKPGGRLSGKSGSTTSTIRWQQGVIMTVQQDPINLLHAGLYMDDRLTPVELVVQSQYDYFALAGEPYIPTVVLRNTSNADAHTMIYCKIDGWIDNGPYVVTYDESLWVSLHAYEQQTVRMPLCTFSPNEGEGNFYMSVRKSDLEPVPLIEIRKGQCGCSLLRVQQLPDGSIRASKTVKNLKDHPCPYTIVWSWDINNDDSGFDKPGQGLGTTAGSLDAGTSSTEQVDFTLPPGSYCIYARITIQGITKIEYNNTLKIKKKPGGGGPPPPPPPPPPPFPPPWPPFPGTWWVVKVPIPQGTHSTDTMRILVVSDTLAWPAFLSKDTLFKSSPIPSDTVFLMVWVPDGTMKNPQVGSDAATTPDTSKYAIVIIDSAGVITGSTTYEFMKADGAPAIMQYQASAGWNLLSLPLTVADGGKSILYPTAISDAFSYQNSYVPKDTLYPGAGYWLKFDSSEAINISGFIDLLDTVDVTIGWNMIGTLSDTVYTNSIVQEPSGIVTSDYFYYNGTYQSATRLAPGKGYWIKTSSTGKLILSYSSWPKIAASPVTDLRRGFNTLAIADAHGRKQTLFFGNTPDKEFNLDRYAMPPLPPEEMFDVRFISQRMLEVHPGELKVSVEFPISVRGGVPPYTLSWQINNSGGVRYSVEFSGTNKSFNSKILSDNGTMVVQDLSRLTLNVGNGKYIPTDFAIRESYPNPFNPISTIAFDLPASGNVQLQVYDVLGQEVASLLDNVAYTAGSYSVRFDASTLASGTYFYRINVYSPTGTLLFQSTKKTLLVR